MTQYEHEAKLRTTPALFTRWLFTETRDANRYSVESDRYPNAKGTTYTLQGAEIPRENIFHFVDGQTIPSGGDIIVFKATEVVIDQRDKVFVSLPRRALIFKIHQLLPDEIHVTGICKIPEFYEFLERVWRSMLQVFTTQNQASGVKREKSPNADTFLKIQNVAEQRELYRSAGKPIPSRTGKYGVYQEEGTSDKTVRDHCPTLHTRWNDPTYIWSKDDCKD